ncbi:MAG: hypothetical protein IT349_00405, partial [Candidatus Eisenbacteria bacterium]|nr:hypothetical protein [Candidatus Eisenbacteria bacterium]
SDWQGGTYNHGNTSFPLTGSHVGADCIDCHANRVYNNHSTDCYSCHQSDWNGTDTPNHEEVNFPTDCTLCHDTDQWVPSDFDHSLTLFPLTGAHEVALCNDCHSDGIYDGKSTLCYSCHQDDWNGTDTPDHQSAGFPTDCSLCHGTSLWVPSTFNHTLTLFPLTGAHLLIPCSDCHGDGVWDGKPTDCWSCHAADFNGVSDPNHQTAHFPHTCLDCHTTATWENATFNHDPWFPIYSGKHKNRWSSCGTCHPNSNDYEQFNCLGCHPHDDRQETDGHHEGENGYQYESHACYNCHPDGRE